MLSRRHDRTWSLDIYDATLNFVRRVESPFGPFQPVPLPAPSPPTVSLLAASPETSTRGLPLGRLYRNQA
jgi:hypothetical protein